MARLQNELSWSRTRIGALQTCRRQYYYQYYQKWGGWEWDADEDARKAYVLSKMTNLPMLMGHAVHETIRRILVDLRDHGEVRLDDPSLFLRKEILTRVWRDAEKGLWKRSVKKHPPVFELYYPEERPDPERLKQVGLRAAECLATFLDSDVYREFRTEENRRWLAVDDEPSFDESEKVRVGGHTVWALPDFARDVDGVCEIWDWKTGYKNPNDELQLLSYALYARDRWGFDADRIRLFGFYLAPGEVVEYSCNADRLAEMEDGIKADLDRMTKLLVDVKANVPGDPNEHFPMVEDLRICQSCVYRELCGRFEMQRRDGA